MQLSGCVWKRKRLPCSARKAEKDVPLSELPLLRTGSSFFVSRRSFPDQVPSEYFTAARSGRRIPPFPSSHPEAGDLTRTKRFYPLHHRAPPPRYSIFPSPHGPVAETDGGGFPEEKVRDAVEVLPPRQNAQKKERTSLLAEGLLRDGFPRATSWRSASTLPISSPVMSVDGDLEEQDLFESVALFFALRVAPAEESAQHVGNGENPSCPRRSRPGEAPRREDPAENGPPRRQEAPPPWVWRSPSAPALLRGELRSGPPGRYGGNGNREQPVGGAHRPASDPDGEGAERRKPQILQEEEEPQHIHDGVEAPAS